MRYLSVCSGIEAATVAWHPLGWEPWAFSEIEAFPSAVLAHHYPNVPNLGDMTKFKEWPDATIDLLVGGTPCQSFSVAGLRKGLDDPRGNLALTYLAIAERYRPRWLVWENVPGVLSSNGGRDFGAFLGALGKLGYGFAYRVLDAQFFGVAQRRRRVFVVANLGDWRAAAAVLFEPESLRGDPPPRREAGQDLAGSLTSRASGGGGGPGAGTDEAAAGYLQPVTEPFTLAIRGRGDSHDLEYRQDGTANAILTPNGGRGGIGVGAVAHALRGRGFDASEDGTGRGTPLVPVAHCDILPTMQNGADTPAGHNARSGHTKDSYIVPVLAFTQNQRDELREMVVAGALAAEPGAKQQTYIAFHNRQDPDVSGDVTHPWGARDNGMAVAFTVSDKSNGFAWEKPHSPTLDATGGGSPNQQYGVREGMSVRRLTPRECERPQGFPDDYTAIPWRGKAPEDCPDGPRYKALGNSMAVPVMRWIGKRIALFESLEIST